MDSTSTLAAAKTAVFGQDPALGPDGQPLERGVGSHWHRAASIAKAHFHAAEAWASCDALVASAKALLANAERISAAVKASIEAAQAAKGEQPVPTDPAALVDIRSLPPLPAAAPDPDKTLEQQRVAPFKDTTLDFTSTSAVKG